MKWLLALVFLVPLAFGQASSRTVVVDGPGVGTVTQIDTSASTMKSQWTSAGGIVQQVITPRREGETASAQAFRHSTAVTALKELFPPVPTEG